MTTDLDPIERMNGEAQATVDALAGPEVASLRTSAEDIFRRAIVLAIGSYCEKRITGAIERFAAKRSSSNEELCAFVKNKAINRQYHTFFSWDANNANTFLKMFGTTFQSAFDKSMRSDQAVEEGIRCFLHLGALRNKLAHESFAEFAFDLTRSDVMRDYRKAMQFIAAVELALNGK